MSEKDSYERRLTKATQRFEPITIPDFSSAFGKINKNLDASIRSMNLSVNTAALDSVRESMVALGQSLQNIKTVNPFDSIYQAAEEKQKRELAGYKFETCRELGQRTRTARKAMKFNQQKFADMAGVGRRFVSELENGKDSLEIGLVLQCCAAAGIDLFAKPRNS